jgi:hypothetical protein
MATKKAIEQLRKITIKNCGATPTMEQLATLEKKGGKATLDILDVFGIATKFKPGQTDVGEYVRFLGAFKASNLVTGDVFTSAVAIFPKVIEEPLWAAMGDEEVNNVQFAYRIGVRFDASAATKYVYTATPLTKPAENDPLAAFERSVTLALEDKGAK